MDGSPDRRRFRSGWAPRVGSESRAESGSRVGRASRLAWAAGVSLLIHGGLIGALLRVEGEWMMARFPPSPSIAVVLAPRAEAPPAIPAEAEPKSEPALEPEPEAESEPEPEVEPGTDLPPDLPSHPHLPPIGFRPPDELPPPPAQYRPAEGDAPIGISNWWSSRMSTTPVVRAWRRGEVAPDTTWLRLRPPEIVARDSAFLRMNEDFLDRIPDILYEKWKNTLLQDFPLMR